QGAAVRVSLVCFGRRATKSLDGRAVASISADLRAGEPESTYKTSDPTRARRLNENAGVSFQGPVLIGPFEIEGDVAREWLQAPNPNGRPNSTVLRPITNGKDITSRTRGLWVVDFGMMEMEEASLFELPFEYVRKNVKPVRAKNPRVNRRERWWIHGETGSGWRAAIAGLSRY